MVKWMASTQSLDPGSPASLIAPSEEDRKLPRPIHTTRVATIYPLGTMAEIYPLHRNGRVKAGLTFCYLHIRAHTSVRIYGRRTVPTSISRRPE